MTKPGLSVKAEVLCDPAIHGGEPIVAGSGTTVRAVAELWSQGLAPDEIPVRLPHLRLTQVFEALRYYLDHRSEIEKYIAANRIPETWHGKKFDPRTGITD